MKEHNLKKNSKFITLTSILLTTMLHSSTASACGTTFDFQNPTLESGVSKQTGAIYRFPNVAHNIDALVEILDVSNATIGDIDLAGLGAIEGFQPELMQDRSKPPVPDQHVDFEIRFVKKNSATPITIKAMQVTAVDIDGGGSGTKEYAIISEADSYTVETPTDLISPSIGHYTPSNAQNTSGISLTNTKAMVTAHFKNISSLRYTAGFTNTGHKYTSNHRLSSLNFGCITYNNPKTTHTNESFCPVTTGETSEVNITVENKIAENNLLIVPSTVINPKSGHIKAYKLDKDGKKNPTAIWDAASKMTVAKRRSKLMSTDKNQQLISIASMTAVDLNVATTQEANIIKNYTFDPSFSSGVYLDGRDPNSLLGAISRGNTTRIIGNTAQTALSLKSSSYRQFQSSYITARKKQVLFSSDDGFLYSVDYNSGELFWGWTPSSIAKKLKNINGFSDNHWMKGKVYIVDAQDSKGDYGSYIVGSYKAGLGHYVLKYNTADTTSMSLHSTIHDNDFSDRFTTGVDLGAKTFFSDASGQLYMVFILTRNNQSTLFIQSVTDSTIHYEVNIDAKVTAEPLIVHDNHSRHAPQAYNLYLGLEDGKVLATPLLNSSGVLNTQSKITQALNQTAIAKMQSTGSTGIQHMGIIQLGQSYYLRTQTNLRLTLHRYDPSNKRWLRLWTSFSEGAGTWDKNQQYTASQALATEQNNHPIIPIDHGVQALPKDAEITAEAYTVAGNLVLPIAINNESMCQAYYYLFSLNNGRFPANTFKTIQGSPINTHIHLGTGVASSIELAEVPNKGDLIGYGNVDQNNDGSVGVPATFIINDTIITGIRSWQIIE